MCYYCIGIENITAVVLANYHMFPGFLPLKLPPPGLISGHMEANYVNFHGVLHLILFILSAHRNSLRHVSRTEHVIPTDWQVGEESTPAFDCAGSGPPLSEHTFFT